jgi:hypothetical protein
MTSSVSRFVIQSVPPFSSNRMASNNALIWAGVAVNGSLMPKHAKISWKSSRRTFFDAPILSAVFLPLSGDRLSYQPSRSSSSVE